MTRYRSSGIRPFNEQEIKRAIADTVGIAPPYTPSLRIMRNVAALVAKTYSVRHPQNVYFEDMVERSTRACALDAAQVELYCTIAKRLVANRHVPKPRRAPAHGRHPHSTRPALQIVCSQTA